MIRTATRPRFTPRPATSWLRKIVALHRQRRALARLDDHLLDDIGLTRADAEAEARRAPWEASAHWLR